MTKPIYELCARDLRDNLLLPNGNKIRASHSFEIAAAFFGYRSYAALRSDRQYHISNILYAEYVFPDVAKIELRVRQFYSDDFERFCFSIASHISNYLTNVFGFRGKIWISENLEEMIVAELVHDEFSAIEDAVSGEMATTNAYYDELYFEEADVDLQNGLLSFSTNGSFNGEQDWDRAFYGNSINISIDGTLEQVAGTSCFANLEMEIDGSVDDSYHEEE